MSDICFRLRVLWRHSFEREKNVSIDGSVLEICEFFNFTFYLKCLPPITGLNITVINSGSAHNTQHRTHCGLRPRLQTWLMPQSPHRLRNDLKCVELDVKHCSIQCNPILGSFLDGLKSISRDLGHPPFDHFFIVWFSIPYHQSVCKI